MIRRYTTEQYIAAVQRHNGNRTAAADELGVSHHTIWSNTRTLPAPAYAPAYAPPQALPPHPSIVRMQAEIDDLRGQLEAVTVVKRWDLAQRRAPVPKREKIGRKHFFLPDCQVKLGVPTDHLEAAGNFVAEKKPDVVVCIGDFADMPSLSSWDKGTLSFEGRRYRLDIESSKAGMERFMAPIRRVKGYRPEMHFTMGNHEYRIDRAVEQDSRLEGLMSTKDLKLEQFGWTVHPFLRPVVVDGVAYSHFFPRAASGKVMQSKNGAPNALAQLRREGRSCFSGHTQGLDLASLPFGGKMQWGGMAGSFYMHEERFLTEQGQDHWHGVLMLHEVLEGCLSPMVVSLDYLLGNYL